MNYMSNQRERVNTEKQLWDGHHMGFMYILILSFFHQKAIILGSTLYIKSRCEKS